MRPRPRLVVVAPLRLEARAARRGAPGAHVVTCGMGPRRVESNRLPLEKAASTASAVVVAGIGGGLQEDEKPGDVVIASALSCGISEGPFALFDQRLAELGDATRLHASLVAAGLRVHRGGIVSSDHIVRGAERAALGSEGAVAVDMESYFVARLLGRLEPGRPSLFVLRVLVDTPSHEVTSIGTLAGVARGLGLLRRALGCVASCYDRDELAAGGAAPPESGP